MKDHSFISPVICLICGEELKVLYPAVELDKEIKENS